MHVEYRFHGYNAFLDPHYDLCKLVGKHEAGDSYVGSTLHCQQVQVYKERRIAMHRAGLPICCYTVNDVQV